MFAFEVNRPESSLQGMTEDQMRQADGLAPAPDIPETGFFSGLAEGWKGLPAGALTLASSAVTAGSEMIGGWMATTPEAKAWLEQQSKGMKQAGKDLRSYRDREYKPSAEALGTAGSILYGLASTLPEAIGLSAIAGPAGGALLFGANMGIDRTQELKDKGVDESTAINAGVLSFATNAVGLRLPAAFGASRLQSTLYGAGSNAGLAAAEVQGIQWALENADYHSIAKDYKMSLVDLAVAGGLGATFGATFWRNGMTPKEAMLEANRVRTDAFIKARDETAALWEKQLLEMKNEEGGALYTPEQAKDMAYLHATMQASLFEKVGLTVADFNEKRAKLIEGIGDPSSTALETKFTQGIAWESGPAEGLRPESTLEIFRPKTAAISDRKSAIDTAHAKLRDGVKNESSGFVLVASKSDMKKSAGAKGSNKEKLLMQLAGDLADVVRKAILVESHVDLVHNNPNVKGIHKFVLPVELNGERHRVQLLVRDYIGDNGAVIHTIDGVSIDKLKGEPRANESQREGSPSMSQRNSGLGVSSPHPTIAARDSVSLTELLNGSKPYVRADGRGFFEAVDPATREKGGVYYDENGYKSNKPSRLEGNAAGWFDTLTNAIGITPKANVATFAHENAHWYQKTLFDLARLDGVAPWIKEDAQTLLNHWGIKDLAAWDALGFEGQRKYFEQFAGWTEDYLSKGKAPSASLADVFKRLGNWIVDVYKEATGKTVSEALEFPELSPEVKAVIEKMYEDTLTPKASDDVFTAAHTVFADRVATDKAMDVLPENASVRAMQASTDAVEAAADALASGEKVNIPHDELRAIVPDGEIKSADTADVATEPVAPAEYREPSARRQARQAEVSKALDYETGDIEQAMRIAQGNKMTMFTVERADGSTAQMTAEEALRIADEDIRRADTEAAGVAEAAVCAINFGSI